jgi:hypothetical protein
MSWPSIRFGPHKIRTIIFSIRSHSGGSLGTNLTTHSWELNTQIIQRTPPTPEDHLAPLPFTPGICLFSHGSIVRLFVGSCYLIVSASPHVACCPLDWTPRTFVISRGFSSLDWTPTDSYHFFTWLLSVPTPTDYRFILFQRSVRHSPHRGSFIHFTWSLLLIATTTDSCSIFVDSLFTWGPIDYHGLLIQPPVCDQHHRTLTLRCSCRSSRLSHSCALPRFKNSTPVVSTPPDLNSLVLLGLCCSTNWPLFRSSVFMLVGSLFTWSHADRSIDYHRLLIQAILRGHRSFRGHLLFFPACHSAGSIACPLASVSL